MAEYFVLTDDAADRVKKMIGSFEGGALTPPYQGSPRPLPGPVETWVGKTTTTITALSGTTPGSGTVELYNLSNGTLNDQGISLTLYNLGSSIASGSWVLLQRDPISGNFLTKGKCC